MAGRTYKQLVDQSIQGVYEKGIATKILQHMGKIRNASDITQARRWVMELLQNAQDLAWEDRPVRVRISLERDRLIFEHTGKPFRVKDILAIINQVSSKDPGESVGQFGTGFITTYQLSEQVEIRSVLKEEDLPYREFHVTLDRSGKTHEELHEAIEKNMRELERADEEGLMAVGEYDKDAFHTAFIYHLDNDRSRSIAQTGMRDLKDTIQYVLLFAHGLQSVEVNFDDEGHERIIYEKGVTRRVSEAEKDGQLWETTILESGEKHYLRHISVEVSAAEVQASGKTKDADRKLTLAMEYDPQRGYLPISERTARVFIDFPLIGAENFPFPMVLNSRLFHPNEPRSGIPLVDLEQSGDAKVNKVLMDKAVALYGRFLGEVMRDVDVAAGTESETAGVQQAQLSDASGVENVITMPMYHENKEWSETWVQTHLYDAIYQMVAAEPIFDTAQGRVSLNDKKLFLLNAGDGTKRQEMIELCSGVQEVLVPQDQVDWYAAMAAFRQIESRNLTLTQILQNAKCWVQEGKIKTDVLAWCMRLYTLGMSDIETENLIRTGNAAIFPNQNLEKGNRTLYTATELYRDPGLPEILKDVTEKLDVLNAQNTVSAREPLKLREKLLHQDFDAKGLAQMQEYSASELGNYLAVRSNRKFPVTQFNIHQQTYLKAWLEAWLLMLACGEDKELYDICTRVFSELKDDKADADTGAHASQFAYAPLRDERFGRSLWKNSYSGLIELLFDMLEQVGNMDRLPENMDAEWMTKLFNNALNYCDVYNAGMRRMFPDQHGTFGTVTALMRDAVRAQELKQIAWCFREQQADCDVQSEMLDRRIALDTRWGLREMRDSEVASRISRAIQRIMVAGNLNDAPELVQEACTGLLAWLQEHPEETKRYFPDFSTDEQQARLMTAKAVVGLQKRSRVFDRLMELTGAGDPEKLMEYVQGMVEAPHNPQYDTYDYESGVFFGEEFGDLPERERRDRLREIGVAGEKYAFEYELRKFKNDGWEAIMEEECRAVFAKNGNTAEVYRPDTADYHQEGWDIRVRYWNGKEDPCDREVLIEVKTHTTTSKKRDILPLSDSQMRLALSEGVNFVVYMVDYDLPGNAGVGVTELSDIGRQIADGKIKCAQDKYLLRVA